MLSVTSNLLRPLVIKASNLKGICRLKATVFKPNIKFLDYRPSDRIHQRHQYCTGNQPAETTKAKSDTQLNAKNDANKPPSKNGSENEPEPLISPEELERLRADLQEHVEQTKVYKDNYQRALAETENVRTRMSKQVQDARQFGIAGFCKELLCVADTMRLASDNVPEDQLENPNVKSMLDGLKLTEAQLLKVLKDHGVVQLNPEGEKFDPNFHEALFEQPIADKEAGTVFIVTKVGYTLHDRVLRPAMVGVVKAV